jgi:hypothetical protein
MTKKRKFDRPHCGRVKSSLSQIEDMSSTFNVADTEQENGQFDDRGRKVIYIRDHDFVTIHNVLYFLYTGTANLHWNTDEVREQMENKPDGYPDPADAFLLYKAADIYMMKTLKDLCSSYLVATCTSGNIVEKLFNNTELLLFGDLWDAYIEHVAKHTKIKATKPWENLLDDLAGDSDSEDLKYQRRTLARILKLG